MKSVIVHEEVSYPVPGRRIRLRRKEYGWSLDLLASLTGLSKGFLSDLENGKRGVSSENLLYIARSLNLSLDFLMENE